MKKLILLGLILLSPAFAHADFNTNLKYGAKGESVREMQEFLADQGVYTGPITGNFYALTLKAVKTFQSNNAISPASGFWGPLTRTKANSLLDLTASDTAEQAETGTLATPTFDNDKLLEELRKQANAMQSLVQNTTPTVVQAPVIDTTPKEVTQNELWIDLFVGWNDAGANSPVNQYSTLNIYTKRAQKGDVVTLTIPGLISETKTVEYTTGKDNIGNGAIWSFYAPDVPKNTEYSYTVKIQRENQYLIYTGTFKTLTE